MRREKNGKRLLAATCALVMAFTMTPIGWYLPGSAGAEEAKAESYEEWEYEELDDGTLEIQCYNGEDSVVTIPSELDGKKVTAVSSIAAADSNYGTEEIIIPEGITTISSTAFLYIENLNRITVKPENPNYCDVDGVLYNKAKTELLFYPPEKKTEIMVIPDSVTSIADDAFNVPWYGLEALVIPAGVSQIGELWMGFFENVTVYVEKDSYAEQWAAKQDGLTYVYSLEDLEIKTLPQKLVYGLNQEVNTAGLTLTAKDYDGNSQTVGNGFRVISFDSFDPGTAEVTVFYGGKTVSYEVTVKEEAVNDLEIGEKKELPLFYDNAYWYFVPKETGVYKITYTGGCNPDLSISPVDEEEYDKVEYDDYADEWFIEADTDCYLAIYNWPNEEGEDEPITVTITKIGDRQETGDWQYSVYEDGNIRITAYTGSESEIKVPAKFGEQKVTEIGGNFGYGNDTVKKVTVPGSIKKIEGCEFSALKELVLEEGVEEIGRVYVDGNTSELTVTIPASVTSIYDRAFQSAYIDYPYHNRTIRGYNGSYADLYARRNSIDFEALDAKEAEAFGSVIPALSEEEIAEYVDQYVNLLGGKALYLVYGDEASVNGQTIDQFFFDGTPTPEWAYLYAEYCGAWAKTEEKEMEMKEMPYDDYLAFAEQLFSSVPDMKNLRDVYDAKRNVLISSGTITKAYWLTQLDGYQFMADGSLEVYFKISKESLYNVDTVDEINMNDESQFIRCKLCLKRNGRYWKQLSFQKAESFPESYDTAMPNQAVDSKTGVTLTSDSSVIGEGSRLEVKPVTEGEAYENVKEVLDTDKFTAYDISILKDGVKVQPNGKVCVSIPLPAGYDEAYTVVYYIDDAGNKTALAAEVKDGMIVFEADHFSMYVVAEEKPAGDTEPGDSDQPGNTDKPGDTDQPNDSKPAGDNGQTGAAATPPSTGDQNMMAVWFAVLLLAGGSCLALRTKRKHI